MPTDKTITAILDKAVAGERITADEGLRLLESHDLTALGRAADAVTRRLHPEPIRTYNIDRNINYTNVCTAVCDFCAFYRGPKSPEGYTLPRDVLLEKCRETVELGGDQILLQGGLHHEHKLEWYEEMLRDIKAATPSINIHGFSPPRFITFPSSTNSRSRQCSNGSRPRGSAACPAAGPKFWLIASATR